MQWRKKMSANITNVIEDLEKKLTAAINDADYHFLHFKRYEQKIIDLKNTINELKVIKDEYHDHTRCL